MATKQGQFTPQAFSELYGVVVGLYGDPANQVTASSGTLMSDAYSLIGWSDKAESLRGVLVWSRLLLVELLVPNDTNYLASNLVLVARPRSLWLYYKDDLTIADFVGNIALAADVGQVGHEEIAEVTPAYRRGDVIRVGFLPAPIDLEYFTDGYTRTSSPFGTDAGKETYNGDFTDAANVRTYTIPSSISAFSVLGASYNSNLYVNSAVSQILYYDKNVDARSRIVGTSVEGNVDIKVCIGGISSTYRVRGTRIS